MCIEEENCVVEKKGLLLLSFTENCVNSRALCRCQSVEEGTCVTLSLMACPAYVSPAKVNGARLSCLRLCSHKGKDDTGEDIPSWEALATRPSNLGKTC